MEQNNIIHEQKGEINLRVIEEETKSLGTTDIRKAAFEYYDAGLRVFPVKQDKTPLIKEWGFLRERPATEDEMNSWFPEGTGNLIALVCGIPDAGNVEPLDFDEKYNISDEPLIRQFKQLVNKYDGGLVDSLVAETSQNGGRHLFYRLSGAVAGNTVLARRPATEENLRMEMTRLSYTLIETRGEGGYIVVGPSNGYKVTSGSLTNIPLITDEQRNMLHECARALNTYVPEDKSLDAPSVITKTRKDGILLPGDDFNMRGDLSASLKQKGWKIAYVQNNVQYWTRPGKQHGISATFNFIPNTFYVWSSNASPFEPEKGYSPFAVYTYLYHEKDFEKAAAELRILGYGTNKKFEYAERVLAHRYEFKYNIIKGVTEYRKRNSKDEFVALTDKRVNSLYRELVFSGCTLPKETLETLLTSDFVPDYDPFIEYFNELTPWDGKTDHIKQLADTVTLTDPNQNSRWLDSLRRWLVATVACATRQKTNQTVLTLHGKQGGYKTTWLMGLLPTKFKAQNQYRISRAVNPDSKDSQITLAENFLINIDELDTMTRFDVGSLKSFITQESVDVRRPYGRRQENLPRRASIVASVNKDDFLVDETGNRRFLIFDVESVRWGHNVDMDLVYAQAYALLNQPGGFKYWFDDKEIADINKINSAYRTKTTEEAFIEQTYNLVEKGKITSSTTWVTSAMVATTLNQLYHIPVNTVKIGKAMTAVGFEKKDSNRGTLYAVDQVAYPTSNTSYSGKLYDLSNQ